MRSSALDLDHVWGMKNKVAGRQVIILCTYLSSSGNITLLDRSPWHVVRPNTSTSYFVSVCAYEIIFSFTEYTHLVEINGRLMQWFLISHGDPFQGRRVLAGGSRELTDRAEARRDGSPKAGSCWSQGSP